MNMRFHRPLAFHAVALEVCLAWAKLNRLSGALHLFSKSELDAEGIS